jgi:HEPN domain-containing protein
MNREEAAFLLDVKALIEHAILHQQNQSRLDIRLAVNHAHQAVELTLRKKAELLGENPYDFPKILKVLKDGGIRIPYERQIEELNKTRTLIQHYGTTPTNTDAERLVFVARDFLMDFWKDALSVDYDSVTLLDLLTNENVKGLLKEAQECMTKDNYRDATIKSVGAIYETQWWIGDKFTRLQLLFESPLDSAFGNVQRELDLILEIALSSPFIHKIRKLRETTGVVFLRIIGGKPAIQMKEHKFTKEDAMLSFELANEYALWAEQVYG